MDANEIMQAFDKQYGSASTLPTIALFAGIAIATFVPQKGQLANLTDGSSTRKSAPHAGQVTVAMIIPFLTSK